MKYIECVEDLTFKEDNKLVESMKEAEHGALEIQIIDNGIGIAEENQWKLFKLFGFLKDSQEKNPKGIGLGLHICKLIVQKFGGDIICRSKVDVGTTFAFLFHLNNHTDGYQNT